MKHTNLFLASSALLPLGGALALTTSASVPLSADESLELEEARIYWEYNHTAEDLGVHVFLDGEDWNRMRIESPSDQVLFDVRGKGPYRRLGMTELFFEGAEPALEDVPLEDLLALFPAGTYEFEGTTVSGAEIEGEGELSHAVPVGPTVYVQQGAGDFLRIEWDPVTTTPAGFPALPVSIEGYQVVLEDFDVIVPGDVHALTVSPEFVASLEPGEYEFDVLAIEASGNQSITEVPLVVP